MQTLCIPVNKGMVTRNILRTDVFKILRETKKIKFIFLVIPEAIPEFSRDFFGDDIEILPIKKPKTSGLKSLYYKVVARNLVWTESSKIVSFKGKDLSKKRSGLLYRAVFGAIGFLGKFKIVKGFFHFLESGVLREKDFDYIFKEHKIDLIFLPDIHGGIDTVLAKAARHFGIKSIGMTRGWDSLCQRLLKAVPDELIVQNEAVKKDAIKFQGIPVEKIFVSGFPQFDLYHQGELLLGRDEYCKKMGLDPARKIIFFGSSGNWSPEDHNVIKYIYELIKDSAFSAPASLIVRPHFSNVTHYHYAEFYNLPNLHVDDKYRVSEFLDNWNLTAEDIKMFINTMNYADVFVTFSSTLALDAAALDKPIINLHFGGFIVDGKDETATLYQLTHYQTVLAQGGVKLVDNEAELKGAIDGYFKNPREDEAGRQRLKDFLCFGADGLAGERVAQKILDNLKCAE